MKEEDEQYYDQEGYEGEGNEELDVEGVGDELGEGEDPNAQGDGDPNSELEAMRERLRQMEAEASKLREMQSKVGGSEGGLETAASLEAGSREEVDARSIYVGNVDYAATPEELQMMFQGFAYVEFLETAAVESALLLDGQELRGRGIKVTQKRTNVPGLKVRGRGRRGAGGFRGGFYPPPFPYYPPPYPYYAPRGRGGAPRGRGRGRFAAAPY